MNRFEKNSRVCFIGDSITHNNDYIAYIADFYNKNFADDNINFYNCGVSGGRTATALSILEDDVLAHRPTHAVILIGVNDSGRDFLNFAPCKERYEKLKNCFNEFKTNYEALCGKLAAQNIKIILCTQIPLNEYGVSDVAAIPGSFALMQGYAEYVRGYAAKMGYGLCDYNAYFTEQMESNTLFNDDRVHPNELGQYHIARCFLLNQGLCLGEFKSIPDYMTAWREKTAIVRDIRATEHLVVKDYTLSDKERLEKVKMLLETKELEKLPYAEFAIKLANNYLKNKPLQAKYQSDINFEMEENFKNTNPSK